MGSVLGSRMRSCGAGAGAGDAGEPGDAGDAASFHDDDISGDELERRTGCRLLPCGHHTL